MRFHLSFLAPALLAAACASPGAGTAPITVSPGTVDAVLKAGAAIASAKAKPATEAPATPPKARATLAFLITDGEFDTPIPTAFATVAGDARQVNENGYVKFELDAEGAIYEVAFEARDYKPLAEKFQLTGNRQFIIKLESTKARPIAPPEQPIAEQPAPAPPKAPAPPAATPAPVTPAAPPAVAACGVDLNIGRVSQECVDAVAARSPYATPCRITGVAEACHYFVREVALALRTAQDDPRWGLIRKTRGGDNVEGYGVDVVAYLPAPLSPDEPTWRWRGADIVGGLGLPNARLMGGALHRVLNCETTPKEDIDAEGWCNRPADVWAPIPR